MSSTGSPENWPPTDHARPGPKTSAGKDQSRRNAITHGLTATTLLPEVLERQLLEDCWLRLVAEYQPASTTEAFFVRELARHEAALARIELIEEAILRRAAQTAEDPLLDDREQVAGDDLALARAGTSHALEKITRYRVSHERAYARSLSGLRKAQQRRSERPTTAATRKFTTEAECEQYLRDRLLRGACGCPRCHPKSGNWLAQRQRWQCHACRRQVGIRHATVMAGSRVPLLAWFAAIESLLKNPQAAMAELMAATNLSRTATVRTMARKIRAALVASQRSQLLAELDNVFTGVNA
jgi:transposase-like protein